MTNHLSIPKTVLDKYPRVTRGRLSKVPAKCGTDHSEGWDAGNSNSLKDRNPFLKAFLKKGTKDY